VRWKPNGFMAEPLALYCQDTLLARIHPTAAAATRGTRSGAFSFSPDREKENENESKRTIQKRGLLERGPETRGRGDPATVAGLLRRCAPVNELTLFVIAKEPWRLRQSTGAIDQLDRHVASLLAMTIAKMVHCPVTQRLGVGPRSRNDDHKTATEKWSQV
jgi:hypothetical protein